MSDLHLAPPVSFGRIQAERPWLLWVLLGGFVALALGAVADALPWDEPITEAAVDARSPWRDELAHHVSFLGSTAIVFAVAAVAALASWRRCPRLALAIVIIALARPLSEHLLKEVIGRDRPDGARLVDGTGHSFPSGHVLATAASWGLVPLVVALYTRRRVLWWAAAVTAWAFVLGVAASRVWLGVHWTSDVVGGLLLAAIGIAGIERLLVSVHGAAPCAGVWSHPATVGDGIVSTR